MLNWSIFSILVEENRINISLHSTLRVVRLGMSPGHMPQPVKGNLAVSVMFYPPSRAHNYINNYLNYFFYSVINAGIWMDDSQIKKLEAEWGPVTKGGIPFYC